MLLHFHWLLFHFAVDEIAMCKHFMNVPICSVSREQYQECDGMWVILAVVSVLSLNRAPECLSSLSATPITIAH